MSLASILSQLHRQLRGGLFYFRSLAIIRARRRLPIRPRGILHTRAAQPPLLARPSSCGVACPLVWLVQGLVPEIVSSHCQRSFPALAPFGSLSALASPRLIPPFRVEAAPTHGDVGCGGGRGRSTGSLFLG